MVSATARLVFSIRTAANTFNNRNSSFNHFFLVHDCRRFSIDYSKSRTQTPLQKQFENWTDRLRPGFTAEDVVNALRSQSDPDLALDIFRWTSQQCRHNYRHSSMVYHTMLQISISQHRHSHAEALIDEILSGASSDIPSLPLLNTIVHFCCSRRNLFSRAFDVFNHMRRLGGSCKPSMETYSMLIGALVRRFDRSSVGFVYMHSVRSLVRQMKSSGVIPDTFLMNLIIKAHSRCLEMDAAIRVYKEMGLYGCEPNEYTYGYLSKGMCEKGRIEEGMQYFRKMRELGFVPTASVYMTVTNSLSLRCRFQEAVEIVTDMIENSMSPDLLTNRTLLEGLCREGREEDAFVLLEELRKKKVLDEKTYYRLFDGLKCVCRPHHDGGSE